MIKIKFHSLVDVITNSSTVIYTYSESSDKYAIEMIDALLESLGVETKAEDMFNFGVFLEEDYLYFESDDFPFKSDNDKENDEAFKELKTDIMAGKIEKPEWMGEVENKTGWSGYSPNTDLCIEAKEEKYKVVAAKIGAFLYSTNHESCYDG